MAGDILKTARDLDLPMVGVGILWSEGYSDQFLDQHGFPSTAGRPMTAPIWRIQA